MTVSTMDLVCEPDAGMADRLFVHKDEKGRSFSTSTPFVPSGDFAKGLRSVPGSIRLADCDDSGLGASITENSLTSFVDFSKSLDVSESMCITPKHMSEQPKADSINDLSQSPLSRWSFLCRRSLDTSFNDDDTIDMITASVNSSRSSCARRLNLDLDLDASSDSEEECCVNDKSSNQSCLQLVDLVETPTLASVPSDSFSYPKTFSDESVLVDRFNDILQKFSPLETDRLIGRKMGRERVDIVGELDRRNTICLSLILSYLEPVDICRMCCVNQQWQRVCNNDPVARKRRKKYIREKKCYLEEIGKENADQKPPDSQVRVVPAGQNLLRALATVQLTNDNPLCPAPLEKKQRTTTDIFRQAANDLKSEESLQKCPKCLKPAKVLAMQDHGQCQNPDCGYEYCTKCMHALHGAKHCPPILAKRTIKDQVGSKKSKKNLKRL